ncbi:MAG TPA: hypothetical protein PL115_01415 [Bacteroidales bacterium]|jgi:hypothetical protein|nr:hypothetical protein [Bacteroidales bacterium]HPB89476.1 hypothetical protein [Bacteroidales bacterium]HPY21727.1 hypothetical protein [Bacteroidales bacterium]HQA93140.1 hypothetical protein [Bacteroidales bacterium]HQP78504.1 hypothetical protein [Bacteroidales bacterium]
MIAREYLYKDKTDISDFLEGQELTRKLLGGLASVLNAYDKKFELIDLLNETYYICTRVMFDPFPEFNLKEYEKEVFAKFDDSYAQNIVMVMASILLRQTAFVPDKVYRFYDQVSQRVHIYTGSMKPLYESCSYDIINNIAYFYDWRPEELKYEMYQLTEWKKVTNDYNLGDIKALINSEPDPLKQLEIIYWIRWDYFHENGNTIEDDDIVHPFNNVSSELQRLYDKIKQAADIERKQREDLPEPMTENEYCETEEKNTILYKELCNKMIPKSPPQTKYEWQSLVAEQEEMEEANELELSSSDVLGTQDDSEVEDKFPGRRTRKVTSAVILEILKPALNDAGHKTYSYTDLARLIAYLTDFSYNKIRTEVARGYTFDHWQAEEIEKVNELFEKIGLEFRLNYSED